MQQSNKPLRSAVAYGLIDSQFGSLIAWIDDKNRLVRLSFHLEHDKGYAQQHGIERSDERVAFVAEQIHQYQRGERRQFSLPIALNGTPFQMRVWQELCDIPLGETITYRTLAERIGNPKAVRAVGRANGTNPISLIVPCHRVIGSDGSLTGYEGGIAVKEKLLNFEKAFGNASW
ncbi:Methylated-DNA--protein-cysteine methyltransferase, inducible [Leminorella richardii]|uniref:Methylated-DNA--protein-cysteine methyltransferase n=1 Tax=Leminorella richardii TaxID=158841 RepID=A0A2X4UPX1_9GAMM|nr:methylated-DNA--[protein]-cysteine S-methyltransferase [Leminorella richardii]SQI41876.1 Methylated-DNA--protein-cysteine methyltransferase, inducible [Leminorella richardii]